MIFWLMALGMAGMSAALVLRALGRSLAGDGVNPDLAVYKAQLAEVDRDLARGMIGAGEAEGLRLEIKRRILDLDRAGGLGGRADGPQSRGVVLALLGVALVSAVALYLRLGAPGYPDLPHSEQLAQSQELRAARPSQEKAEAIATAGRPAPAAADAEFATLMDQLRAAVAARPDDVQGLRLLAENERKLGRLPEAARAQEQLLAALGKRATAQDWASLADSLVNAAGGVVTADGEAAILSALKADPANPTARFYAGLHEAQIGRPDLAFAFWSQLLESGPADAPWVPFITARLPEIAAAAGVDYEPPPAMADQAAMIAGMVEGLESRLMEGGGSAEEWAQLVRALGVLGAADRLNAAWARAQEALADDAGGLALVRAEAEAAGIAP